MVQYDNTPGANLALGGAGGAVQGFYDVLAKRQGMQLAEEESRRRDRELDITNAHLADAQHRFETEQAFREKLAQQELEERTQMQSSGRTAALDLIDSAMMAEGTTRTPATPDESPLSPMMRSHWHRLEQDIASGKLTGRDALAAAELLSQSHAQVFVQAHREDLKKRIHNAEAAGAFTVDADNDGEPDDDIAQLPEAWTRALKGGADPRAIEEDIEATRRLVNRQKTRQHSRMKRTKTWQARIDEAHTAGSLTDEELEDAVNVLGQLNEGVFEDPKSGYDDGQSFELHMKAAMAGQMVVKHRTMGEISLPPKAYALLMAQEAQLAMTGSRRAGTAAGGKQPQSAVERAWTAAMRNPSFFVLSEAERRSLVDEMTKAFEGPAAPETPLDQATFERNWAQADAAGTPSTSTPSPGGDASAPLIPAAPATDRSALIEELRKARALGATKSQASAIFERYGVAPDALTAEELAAIKGK